jgi:protein-tyrosine phosphatase
VIATRVLFVCLGNICRSPAAHAVIARRVTERQLHGLIALDSAATGSWHTGELPHRQSRSEGQRRGFDVNHVVRQVEPSDFVQFDLIVGMDQSNRRDLRAVARSSQVAGATDKIVLLRSFDPLGTPDVALDDPYGKPDSAFAAMYDIIERCADPLIDAVLQINPTR